MQRAFMLAQKALMLRSAAARPGRRAFVAAASSGSGGSLLRAAAAAEARAAPADASSFRQMRISPGGTLRAPPGAPEAAATAAPDAPAGPRPPALAAAAPDAPPMSAADLEALAELLHSHKKVVCLTGAGISTESNIPDYRGPRGAYTTGFKPMTHQQFVGSPQARARYWARSFAGWYEFSAVKPNPAHEGLARLQARGWVGPIITQNVDRLHQRAGTRDVLELHGTTHRVICMACGADSCRHDLQQTLAELNPEAAARASAAASAASAAGAAAAYARALRIGTAADARATVGDGSDGDKGPETVPVRRPDGDVELRDAGVSFIVPACPACGADALKPDVVFFGDSIPKERAARAGGLAAGCDALLVIGSSVQVFSAFRLTAAAKEAGARLVLLNVGDTRADGIADVKYPVLAGEALMRLATHPGLLLPRV